MTNTNITNFRKNIFGYINQAIEWGDVINISTKDGNAVVMGEEEYRALMETVHLMSIPGMVESIKKASEEPIGDGVDASELEW